MIIVVLGLPLKLIISILLFHFVISARVFSAVESINMPTPPADELFLLRQAEMVIRVNFPNFSYLNLSSS